MKTRAAVLYKPHSSFVIETVELDEPHDGEVLVRLRAVGVCHSDWHLVTGATQHPMPVVAGHEGAGVVEEVGSGVTRIRKGDHVVLNWAPSCGNCFYCRVGRPSLCSAYVDPIWAGTMIDGTTRLSKNGEPLYHFSALAAFSEFAVVPQECCVPIHNEVPMPVAALIGCAVTTGVGAVLNTARVTAGSSVAVFGVGGVGLSIIAGALYAGAETIIAIDRNGVKRTIASDLGSTHFFLNDESVVERIRDVTGGRGADYVFEAVGIPSVQEQCLSAVRPGGVVVLAGIAPIESSTNLPGATLTRQEKTVMGSYYGTSDPASDFPKYARLYLEGQLKLDRLISQHYRLDQINEAYQHLLAGESARGVIVFD